VANKALRPVSRVLARYDGCQTVDHATLLNRIMVMRLFLHRVG